MAQKEEKRTRRFGQYTSFIYFLIVVAAAELIGLGGLLISGGTASAAQPSAQEDLASLEDTIPDWLEPADQTVEEKKKPEGEASGPEILAQEQIITHGMGAVDGEIVLNCLEGFEAMYAQGVRVFEADLRLTSDGRAVLRHDWRKGWQPGIQETSVPTLEVFLEAPILGKYTPLSFQDLLRLMEAYPDICIVTDTKAVEAEFVRLQFDAMLQDAKELGLSYLLDRFVVQVYSPLMFQVVDSIHHFEGYLYTFYLEGFDGTEDTFRQRAEFCVENGILGITLEENLWRDAYAGIAAEYGLAVYTHTVDDLNRARALLESGVSGIYTDSLTPGGLEPAAEGTEERDTAESHTADNNTTEGETE